MSVTLDGQNLFDQQQIEIERGSLRRDSLEKTVAGLDGVLSIDLGGRGRKLTQSGVLCAKSKQKLDQRIGEISAFMDGNTHTLITIGGEQFSNLRLDSFKVINERPAGSGVAVDYEITYTQLEV